MVDDPRPYRFEWHGRKARANLVKHGVSFGEAVSVFGDPFNILIPDPGHGAVETRYLLLGMSTRQRLLVISFVERNRRTRLISARQAKPWERRDYEEKG